MNRIEGDLVREAVVVSDLETGKLLFWHDFRRGRVGAEESDPQRHKVAIHANGQWIATAFDSKLEIFKVNGV